MTDNPLQWLEDYFNLYRESLFDREAMAQLVSVRDLFRETAARNGRVFFAGNGGSAAIASHLAIDLTKSAGVRAVCFNEPSQITCLANDYGYERWVEKAIEMQAVAGDSVVLISSSGKSPNIVNAAKRSRELGLPLVTLSGFSPDNPLRQLGQINLYVDSRAYNIVENTHQVWLLAVVDLLIGKSEYPAS